MSVYGEHLFGQVYRTPGLFYVSTIFFHVNYVPLFPLRTYLVMDGSDKGSNFNGVRIPLSFRSILAGYLRGWLGTIAVFTGMVAMFSATSFYVGVQGAGIVAVIAAGLAMLGVMLYIFMTRTWWFLPVQIALLLISAGIYYDINTKVPNAIRVPGAAPGTEARRKHDASFIDAIVIANAAALLYSLTRFLSLGSYRKALDLGKHAGIPPEVVAAHFVKSATVGSSEHGSNRRESG